MSVWTAGGRGVHGRQVGPTEEVTFTVPDETVLVRVHAAASGRDWPFREEALVPPGTRDVTLRMVRAERIRGRLLGPDGAPLVGGEVLLEVAGAVAMAATAEADGSFDLPVRPGTVGDLVHVGVFHVPVAGGQTRIQVRPYAARLDGRPSADSAACLLRAGIAGPFTIVFHHRDTAGTENSK